MSTRKKRMKPVEEATSFILLSKDKPGIEGKYINSEKGTRQQIILHSSFLSTVLSRNFVVKSCYLAAVFC